MSAEGHEAVDSGRGRPRIAVDGFYGDRAYGFGRYVRELVAALDRRCDEIEVVVVVPSGREGWTATLSERTRIVVGPYCSFPIWEQLVVPWVAARYGCGAVHFPYQSSSIMWPADRSVVTIHDLMFLRASVPGLGWMSMLLRLVQAYRTVAFQLHSRRAGEIVAVSEATQRDLAAIGVGSNVVPNVCESFVACWADVPPARDLGRFFLHRGHTMPHKNTRRIVEAFARVRKTAPDVSLVLYGVTRDSGVLEGLPSDGVTIVGAVSDETLAGLYRAAEAVVVASLDEGFALSIIEGFGFETAVITSSTPPMCDVAGDAALLVDPKDIGAIARAMDRLLSEPGLRRALLREGKRRYAFFSSERVAGQLAAVYKRVLAPRLPAAGSSTASASAPREYRCARANSVGAGE